MIVYGDSGVGKTVFSSTAPTPLFADVEGGLLSVQQKKIDFVRVDNYDTIVELYDYLYEKKHNYETLVIDSLTELQKITMDSIIEKFPDVKRPYGDSASQGDWGRNIEVLRRVLRAFRDLDLHIIFTCLSAQVKDEIDGSIFVKPALAGKTFADEVCAYVDIVGYLFVQKKGKEDGEIIRKLLVQSQGKYIAKDRSGKLGKIIENPDFTKILKLINEKGEKK